MTDRMTPQQRLVVTIAVLGSFVAFLDGTVVNVALPAIARELGGGLSTQQWAVDAYLVTLVSLILVAGAASDAYGRLLVLRIGLVGFGVASLAVAVAPTIELLIAARALQGLAGAFLVPSSLALITSTMADPIRSRAIGLWTALTTGAMIVGPLIGGVIVDGGTFAWSENVEKFPGLTEPDPSYHGASYTTAVGDGLAYIIKARVQLLRDLGAAISPQSAWLLIQGIETLSLRIERHVQNAQEIAEWLENHPDVASVNYSGLPSSPWYAAANRYAPKGVGAVLSFELKGGVEAGRAFVNSLTLFSHLANIGDVRSLVIHPASTTHSQLTPEQQLTTGVTPGLVRLSVGLENIDDLTADLEQALSAARRFAEAARA